MKTVYMILSGLILSIIGTVVLAGLLSVTTLLKPKTNTVITTEAKKDVACIFTDSDKNEVLYTTAATQAEAK